MNNSIVIFLLFSCMLNIIVASVNILTKTPIKIEFTRANDTTSTENENKDTSTLDTNFEDELTTKKDTDVVTNSLDIYESENEPVIEPHDNKDSNSSEKNDETSTAPKPEAEPEQTSIIPEPEAKPEQTTEEKIEATTITVKPYILKDPNFSEKNVQIFRAHNPEAEPEQTSIISEPKTEQEQTTEGKAGTTTITIIAYKAKSDPESELQTESEITTHTEDPSSEPESEPQTEPESEPENERSSQNKLKNDPKNNNNDKFLSENAARVVNANAAQRNNFDKGLLIYHASIISVIYGMVKI